MLKIISGGQTGVDRAALDAALSLNIDHGGFCPLGRIAEDGIIEKKYMLTETNSTEYASRTKANINASDATLIVIPTNKYRIIDGTKLTIAYAKSVMKPTFILYLDSPNIESLLSWIKKNKVSTLNIAGPRETDQSPIYKKSKKIISIVLRKLAVDQ